MNECLLIDADTSYRQAEQRAEHYYIKLYELVTSGNYESELIEDFHKWGMKQRKGRTWLTRLLQGLRARGKEAELKRQDSSYISWLEKQGRLDAYVERSVSYIYLRDLGQRLDQPATQEKITNTVQHIKAMLMRSVNEKQGQRLDFLGLDSAYRWAQKEGVEAAVIWVIGKLKLVEQHLPEQIDAVHALRKLIKIIVGVVMHAMDQLDEFTPPQQRVQSLDQAIRLGYCYGLTYPFIDDLLDSSALAEDEKLAFAEVLRHALMTGEVPSLQQLPNAYTTKLAFIHQELSEAFQYVISIQHEENQQQFFQEAYVFFHAQEIDRIKQLSNTTYRNEQLYIPIILKSASSRLIARSLLSADKEESFEQVTFYYGIYNQLADDFSDLFDDLKSNAVTPYTYYLTHYKQRADLINPFQLYWAVIAYLIHHVYDGDERTRDVILGRAIGSLKRFKLKHGAVKYNELMDAFAGQNMSFRHLLTSFVEQATDDVEFLDKLVRDQLIESLLSEREEKGRFREKLEQAVTQINETLLLENSEAVPYMRKQLIEAANYSLEGGGKRLRPLMAWIMGVEQYQLSAASLLPLLHSLEYMHTASLIIDDLPTQDNADSRRGRPTLHTIHTSAMAELTSLLLIQRAIHEQSSLQAFDPNAVLAMMRYSSKKAEELCIGQAMDLQSKGQILTLEQLNEICYYKTAIAFEAALVMPAILAGAAEEELAVLKRFAYHAGIAFQIRDDLLDVSGDARLLGKPVGLDKRNATSNFVSVLGTDGAQQAMWSHYCEAAEALKTLQLRTTFLHSLLHYIIFRNH